MSNILSQYAFENALKRKGWTLKRLADEYDKRYTNENGSTIYNTLRKWRSHDGNPTLDKLIRICDILECDIDYLLGRIEEQTHENKFIHEKTGLSEDVINKLNSFLKHPQGVKRLEILNILLNDSDFSNFLLDRIIDCKKKFNLYCNGNKLLQEETKKQKNRFCNNILKKIEDVYSGTYKPLMTRERLNELNTDKDASIYLTQIDFNNILKRILENDITDPK